VFGEDYGRPVIGNVLDALNPQVVAETKDNGGDCLEESINQGVIPKSISLEIPVSSPSKKPKRSFLMSNIFTISLG
jgi:hypothetical protein